MERYVTCIDNKKVEHLLTINKKYKVISNSHTHWEVMTDDRRMRRQPLYKWRFKDALILNKNIIIL